MVGSIISVLFGRRISDFSSRARLLVACASQSTGAANSILAKESRNGTDDLA